MSIFTTVEPQPSSNEKTALINNILDACAPAGLFGWNQTNTLALTWAFFGGSWPVQGALAQVASATITLAANTTNYIEADLMAASASAVVLVNQTGFTPGRQPLYIVVTGASGVANDGVTDVRPWVLPTESPFCGYVAIPTTGGSTTLNQAQLGAKVIRFTGALTSNATNVFPLVTGAWYIDNQTTGAYTLTCGAASGATVTVASGGRALIYCDGTGYFDIVGNATTGIAGVSAADATIVIGGTSSNPTFKVGTVPLSQVSGAANDSAVVHLAGAETITGLKTCSGGITGLPTPVNPSDAATKAYADATAQNLSVKLSVVALLTTNLSSLSGTPTIDGIALSAGQRVGLIGQSTGSQNGIWVTASGAWTRPADFATGGSASGAFFFVEEGTNNGGSGWVCITTPGSDVIDTNALTFAQFSGAGEITNGTGLNKSGNALSVAYGTAAGTAAQGNDSRITGAAQLASQNTFTAAQSVIWTKITGASGAITLDLRTSNNFKITLSGAITGITLSNPTDGQVVNIKFKYGGAYGVSGLPSSMKWAGGTAPTFTATSGAVDLISAIYDGDDTRYESSFQGNLS